jgi:hypothetical protein
MTQCSRNNETPVTEQGANMNDSIGIAASRAVVRYLVTGVAATITTVAALGSWMTLAVAGVGSPGLPASSARQRRGRTA